MPMLFVHIRNATFHSCDAGIEYDGPESALVEGIRGAVAIIADEINQGARSASVEISVERADGTQLLRSVVSTSVSPLILLTR